MCMSVCVYVCMHAWHEALILCNRLLCCQYALSSLDALPLSFTGICLSCGAQAPVTMNSSPPSNDSLLKLW